MVLVVMSASMVFQTLSFAAVAQIFSKEAWGCCRKASLAEGMRDRTIVMTSSPWRPALVLRSGGTSSSRPSEAVTPSIRGGMKGPTSVNGISTVKVLPKDSGTVSSRKEEVLAGMLLFSNARKIR